MKLGSRWLIPATLLALFALFNPASAQNKGVMEKIEAALPEKAYAKPKQPRKLLIYSRTNGFRHGSIATGARAITLMGDKTGAFTAVHTEDESFFEPEKLKAFDAVLMLNTTGDCLRPKELPKDDEGKKKAMAREEMLKQSLLDFVKSGKGLAGTHSATDTYHRWKEYNDMMGGAFAGHPWHTKVPIKNMDPKNPVNAAFDGKDFEATDEIYQFRNDTASPTERHILLALDTEKFDVSKGSRKDKFYPVSWIRNYDKGRCFYCSLGHRDELYYNPTILKHYLAGIQFALGDLEANAAPTQKADGSSGSGSGGGGADDDKGFRPLFNGKDLTGWTGASGKEPGAGWKVEDGALTLTKGGGNIWSKERFGDFVLELEFKTMGNSGLLFRVDKPGDYIQTGIEMQVDKPGGPSKHSVGAIYDLLAPSKNAATSEWNKVQLTCKDNLISVVLNGEKIVDNMDLNKWTEGNKNPDGTKNKFKNALKDFKREGHIGFQDHGAPVQYRNVRIKELK
ncbi:MAG: family 16 glycoside hydrolase [Gemmataceae bacterium]